MFSGANIECKDHDSFTPLLTAASYGRTKIVGILLARQADVEQTDLNGRTALHWAVKANNKNTMQVHYVHSSSLIGGNVVVCCRFC